MGRKSPDEIAYLRRRTWEVLAGGSQAHESKPGRDWIGNRWETGASKINVMLIRGATWEQLAVARGAVQNHLDCLTKDLGLPVVCRGGLYMFDRAALEGKSSDRERGGSDRSGPVEARSPAQPHPAQVPAPRREQALPVVEVKGTLTTQAGDPAGRMQRTKLMLEIAAVAITVLTDSQVVRAV